MLQQTSTGALQDFSGTMKSGITASISPCDQSGLFRHFKLSHGRAARLKSNLLFRRFLADNSSSCRNIVDIEMKLRYYETWSLQECFSEV
jgi:hypothetical protein